MISLLRKWEELVHGRSGCTVESWSATLEQASGDGGPAQGMEGVEMRNGM